MFNILVFLGTKVASTATFLLAQAGFSAYLAATRTTWLGVWLMVTTLVMSVVITLIKNHFAIPRPEAALILANGYAFPSAHTAGAVFFSTTLFFIAQQVLKSDSLPIWFISLTVLTLLIGYSRIYFGVHTPIQVLAGAGIGLLFSVMFYYGALKIIALA